MIPPLLLLTQNLRLACPEWSFAQLERRGKAHPLVMSGILTPKRLSNNYECPYDCCDAALPPYTRRTGAYAVTCPQTGTPLEVPQEHLIIWQYNPPRMAQICRELLQCPQAQPLDANTWCLGPSDHPALAGRTVYLQTRAAAESLRRALAATPNTPYILLTGRTDDLSETSPLRTQTFTFTSVLTLSTDGTPALLPHAFAALQPLPATQNDTVLKELKSIRSDLKVISHKVDGDYEPPNLRSHANSRLIDLAINKYWKLVNKGTPQRNALTIACLAVEKECGRGEYKSSDSFKNSVRREINKNSHALMEHPETT